MGLEGEVAGEELRPEGGVEREAAESAGGDGEAAEVAEPQRGGRGAELQDARPQLVGEIGRRHVRLGTDSSDVEAGPPFAGWLFPAVAWLLVTAGVQVQPSSGLGR